VFGAGRVTAGVVSWVLQPRTVKTADAVTNANAGFVLMHSQDEKKKRLIRDQRARS
jgi:hypothetical protein